jgi:hypothetical protein
MSNINLPKILWVFMAVNLVVIEVFFLDELSGLLSGTCCGALGEISMSLLFQVRDRVKPISFPLWSSSQISFFISLIDLPHVGGTYTWTEPRSSLLI